MSKPIREQGAHAYGMLFFKSDSPRCPKQGVIWERFDAGLEVMAVDATLSARQVMPCTVYRAGYHLPRGGSMEGCQVRMACIATTALTSRNTLSRCARSLAPRK